MPFAQNITKLMMEHRAPGECWRAMNREYIDLMLPELAKTRTVMQRQGETVFEHTLGVLNGLETKNPVTLWAAIFHDVGKTSYSKREYFSNCAFPRHEFISAEIAERRLYQWHVDGGLIFDVTRLVRHHMIDIAGFKQPQAYRNFIASVGLANLSNWFALRRADAMAYGVNPFVLGMIAKFQENVMRLIDRMDRVSAGDLAVTHAEVASGVAVRDEKQAGQIIERLLDAVNSGLCGNNHAQLIRLARAYAGMDRGGEGMVLG